MRAHLSLILAIACTSACASTQKAPVQNTTELAYIDPDENKPPTDFEFTVKDSKPTEHPVVITDEKETYNTSVNTINQTINREAQEWAHCGVESKLGAKDPTCKAMLKEFCSIDVLIDSRGEAHRKPYCPVDPSTLSSKRTFNNP